MNNIVEFIEEINKQEDPFTHQQLQNTQIYCNIRK